MMTTPAKAASEPPTVRFPIGSLRISAANTIAISGAMKVNATACAIGTRASPQKKRIAIGTIIVPAQQMEAQCSALAAMDCGWRKRAMAARAIPISDRHISVGKVPMRQGQPLHHHVHDRKERNPGDRRGIGWNGAVRRGHPPRLSGFGPFENHIGRRTFRPRPSATLAKPQAAASCCASAASISAALASTSLTMWSIMSASWTWWSVTPDR